MRKALLPIAAFAVGAALNLSGIQIPLLAIACFLIAGIATAWLVATHVFSQRRTINYGVRAFLVLAITVGVFVCVYLTIAKDRHNLEGKIYSPFLTPYRTHPELGKPLGEALQQRFVYYAVHDNAIVIWLDAPASTMYRLALRDNTWAEYADAEIDRDPNLEDNAWLRERFHVPEGNDPPYSGVAKFWNRDEANWSWIGWRKWHCDYIDSVIKCQEFEHGYIVGGFQRNRVHPDVVVFILPKGAKWSTQVASMAIPRCDDPIERRRRLNQGGH